MATVAVAARELFWNRMQRPTACPAAGNRPSAPGPETTATALSLEGEEGERGFGRWARLKRVVVPHPQLAARIIDLKHGIPLTMGGGMARTSDVQVVNMRWGGRGGG